MKAVLPLSVFFISHASAAQKNKPICALNAGGDACDLPDGVTAFIRQKSHESGEKTVTLAAADTVSGYSLAPRAKIMFSSAVGGSCQRREGRGIAEDRGKAGKISFLRLFLYQACWAKSLFFFLINV